MSTLTGSNPTIRRRGSNMTPPQPSANAVVERLAFSPDEVAEALASGFREQPV